MTRIPRRDFLKSTGAALALLLLGSRLPKAVPVEGLPDGEYELYFPDFPVFDFGGRWMEGGRFVQEVIFDASDWWAAARLKNKRGDEWRTLDQGITWVTA